MQKEIQRKQNKVSRSFQYDDIINMPHPVSRKHPHMARIDRAAQFAPFAALTGHSQAVRETARLTDRRVELDEYCKAVLDEKLRKLRTQIQKAEPEERSEIAVTYFVPDGQKDGGAYETVIGRLKKLKEYEHQLVMEDGTLIPVQEIYEIEEI